MKKLLIYSFLYTKRQMKQRSFLLLLVLLPALVSIFSNLQRNEAASISVALYMTQEEDSTLSHSQASSSRHPALPEVSALIDTLKKEPRRIGDTALHFYICDSLDTLEQDVRTGKAECGYCIPDSLYQSLAENKKNNLVQVITSPSTTLSSLTNEILYASLFRDYALYILQTYLLQESPFSSGELQASVASDTSGFLAQVSTLYHKYLTDGSTFCFTYDTQNALDSHDSTSSSETVSLLLSPIRGLVGLFIMIAGFCGGYFYYNDKENHVYDNRTFGVIYRLQALSILIPTVLTSIMGIFCLYTSHLMVSLFQELLSVLWYDLLVVLVIWILLRILRNKLLFVSCIPVFVLGSCAFTPIFMDIAAYLPVLRPLRYLFLPYYYLL